MGKAVIIHTSRGNSGNNGSSVGVQEEMGMDRRSVGFKMMLVISLCLCRVMAGG